MTSDNYSMSEQNPEPPGSSPTPVNVAAAAVFENPFDAPPGCRGNGPNAPGCTAPVAALVQPRGVLELQTRMCQVHATEALKHPAIVLVVYGDESFEDAEKSLRRWLN